MELPILTKLKASALTEHDRALMNRRRSPVATNDQEQAEQEGYIAPENISWDKFKRYVSPIVPSFEKLRPSQITVGDIYTAQRKSGSEMRIVPLYVDDWTTKGKGGFVKNWLLIAAFNGNNDIIGIRSNYLVFDSPVVHASGFVASAVCGEGVASALETVRERAYEELLERFREEVGSSAICHKIEDDNSKVLKKLTQNAAAHPDDPNLQERQHHAAADRPRWESLFGDNSPYNINAQNEMWTYPQPQTLNRGFSHNGELREAFAMRKIDTAYGSQWLIAPAPQEVVHQATQDGLCSYSFIKTKLKKAIIQKPQ